MMKMDCPCVKTGLWYDYNGSGLNRYQILVSVKWSGIITNAVAILVAAMTPSVFNLLIGPINWLWRKITTMLCEEGRPLQDGGFEYQVLLKWCLHDLLPERVMNFLVGEKTERKPEDPPKIDFVLDRVVLALVLLVLPVCLITASVVSAGLATTSIGVSNSPHCGEWETQFHLDDFMEPFLQFEHATETDSIKYAANCYESNPSSEDCSKFYNESIAYSVEAGIPCQFDGQVCNDMGEGAFKLSTGLVSGSVLGINARNPFLFSRTMTCSPIVTGDKEVTLGLSDQGEEQWQYWYGQSLAEYTWANPVQESPWEIKGYSTSVHCSKPGSTQGIFDPLPDFRAGPYPVSIIFIWPHSILYPEYRQDPVFSATDQAQFSPGYRGSPYFYKNSTRAGVLGCVDQYRICQSLTGPCWDNTNLTSAPYARGGRPATEEELVIRLLSRALAFSTACGSIQYTGAEALDAQSKLSHMQSLPLAKRQWVVESEKLFKTSLARIQLNVFNLVHGTASKYDGYHNMIPSNYKGMCRLVETPVHNLVNINFLGLLGTISAVIVFWVISRRRKVSDSEETLVIVIIWRWMEPFRNGAVELVKSMWEILKPVWEFVETWVLIPTMDFMGSLLTC